MVLANYLRQNLLEPLKERQRREGWEEGRRLGIAIGRAEGFPIGYAEGREEGLATGIALGRSESDAKWRAWNERRERAAARGEPFDEPPPSFDA